MDIKRARMVGGWSPADIGSEWKEVVWNIPADKARSLKGVRFQHIRGSAGLEICEVALEMDGVEAGRAVKHGHTGKNQVNNAYMLDVARDAAGNNSCRLRAKVRRSGDGDSYGSVVMIK